MRRLTFFSKFQPRTETRLRHKSFCVSNPMCALWMGCNYDQRTSHWRTARLLSVMGSGVISITRRKQSRSFLHSPPCKLMRVPPIRCVQTSTRIHQTLVESRNARTNAFVHLPNDPSSRLTSVDGPLSGMTVAVKDNICTSGMPTTCSSLMLKGALGISSLFQTGPKITQNSPPHTTRRL
jgi:hypothetical protein